MNILFTSSAKFQINTFSFQDVLSHFCLYFNSNIFKKLFVNFYNMMYIYLKGQKKLRKEWLLASEPRYIAQWWMKTEIASYDGPADIFNPTKVCELRLAGAQGRLDRKRGRK